MSDAEDYACRLFVTEFAATFPEYRQPPTDDLQFLVSNAVDQYVKLARPWEAVEAAVKVTRQATHGKFGIVEGEHAIKQLQRYIGVQSYPEG